MIRRTLCSISLLLAASTLSGCWLIAAGAGAEAVYVATQEDRTAGETVTDQVITARVKTALLADPDVAGLDIDVDTHQRVVTLRGVVDSDYKREKALNIAETTNGVESVRSKLFVASDS